MGGMCSSCGCCRKLKSKIPSKECSTYSKGDDGFFMCKDGANCPRANGTVWGSGPYTSDSAICAAARHDGAIGDKGGVFKITKKDGQDSYEGSEKNGVTTQNYGAYDSSISISKLL